MRLIKILLFFSSLVASLNLLGANKELEEKKRIVDHKIESSLNFDKKTKILMALESWVNTQLKSHSDKLTDENLTELMQYSTALKSLNLKNLNLKNCKSSEENMKQNDLTPLNPELSPPAQKITKWLKLLCSLKK